MIKLTQTISEELIVPYMDRRPIGVVVQEARESLAVKAEQLANEQGWKTNPIQYSMQQNILDYTYTIKIWMELTK